MFGGNQHLPNRREVGLSSDELASRSIRTVRLSAFRIQLSLGAKAADTPKQPRPVASGGRTQRPLCSARIPSPDFLDHRARPPLPTPKRSFEHPTVGVMQQSSEPGLDGPFAAGTFTRASLAGRATRRCVRPPPLAWIPWAGASPRRVSFPSKKFHHKLTSADSSGIDETS
jgi:hypothetical protein